VGVAGAVGADAVDRDRAGTGDVRAAPGDAVVAGGGHVVDPAADACLGGAGRVAPTAGDAGIGSGGGVEGAEHGGVGPGCGVLKAAYQLAISAERLLLAQDQVVRADLRPPRGVLVIADHQVALAVDGPIGRSGPRDDLHV